MTIVRHDHEVFIVIIAGWRDISEGIVPEGKGEI
jgi:hypothetical protein